MTTRIRFLLPGLVLLLLLPRTAHADERVPMVPSVDLPAAGTCAPLRKTGVTHVLVGRKNEFGWYRIASQRNRILNDAELVQVLKERAAGSMSGTRSEHSVWITAAKDHRWAHVVKVVLNCNAAGIYRVGLRVRNEATNRVQGFPLFLPGPVDANAPASGKATQMDVRVQTFAKQGDDAARPTIPGANPIKRDVLEASDLNNVFVVATRAVKKFGKVVASVRMATNATVQDAVRVLDYLYRGGCSAVRVRFTTNIASPKIDVYSVVWIGRDALGTQSPLRPPPAAQHTEPWSTDGANQPGWAQLELEPMPDRGAPTADTKVLPNFAARGHVPAFEYERADATIRNWAQGLSADLVGAARGGPQLVSHLVDAARRPEVVSTSTRPVRTFADVDTLGVSTFIVSAHLYGGSQGVGIVDLLVHVAPTRMQLVYARWRGAAPAGEPGPRESDPFGAGTAGLLRVWVEAMCLSARDSGAAALPMAHPQDVLAGLPTAAHASWAQMMSSRNAELAQLVQGLRSAKFDRVVLQTGQLTASAVRNRAVIGVLYAKITPESGDLRLDTLTARRAH